MALPGPAVPRWSLHGFALLHGEGAGHSFVLQQKCWGLHLVTRESEVCGVKKAWDTLSPLRVGPAGLAGPCPLQREGGAGEWEWEVKCGHRRQQTSPGSFKTADKYGLICCSSLTLAILQNQCQLGLRRLDGPCRGPEHLEGEFPEA